jgi:iron(III) transport system substrate-binding protein
MREKVWVVTMDLRADSLLRGRENERHPRRRVAFVSTVATVAFALAACGSASAAPPSATTSDAATSSASAVVPLVVYSAQGYDSVVTKAFQQATGIPVKLDDDSTGPLLTKVAAERNNPQWGLLWVDGATAFASLDKQGQLLDYTSPTALTTVGQSLVPSDHSYVPISTRISCNPSTRDWSA